MESVGLFVAGLLVGAGIALSIIGFIDSRG